MILKTDSPISCQTNYGLSYGLVVSNFHLLMSKQIIGGRFAPLTILVDEDAELDSMVTEFNKVITDTATEFLGKQHQRESLNN